MARVRVNRARLALTDIRYFAPAMQFRATAQ